MDAACTLQRAYRIFRSKKLTGRLRFELWEKTKAQHAALLAHLTDSNTLSLQGRQLVRRFGLEPSKAIAVDAVDHPLVSDRLWALAAVGFEQAAIRREYDQHVRHRLRARYEELKRENEIRRGSVLPIYSTTTTTIPPLLTSMFTNGLQPLILTRKFKMGLRMVCGLGSDGSSGIFGRLLRLKDLRGARGAKFLARNGTLVQGMDLFNFEEFIHSKHLRYAKASVYQGQWSGIPLFSPLKPHGEGLVIFLDGWGYSRETKMIKLKIYRCAFLPAVSVDASTSDPYCLITCNNKLFRTTTKWGTLHPEYNESFEIDITNPGGELLIEVSFIDG